MGAERRRDGRFQVPHGRGHGRSVNPDNHLGRTDQSTVQPPRTAQQIAGNERAAGTHIRRSTADSRRLLAVGILLPLRHGAELGSGLRHLVARRQRPDQRERELGPQRRPQSEGLGGTARHLELPGGGLARLRRRDTPRDLSDRGHDGRGRTQFDAGRRQDRSGLGHQLLRRRGDRGSLRRPQPQSGQRRGLSGHLVRHVAVRGIGRVCPGNLSLRQRCDESDARPAIHGRRQRSAVPGMGEWRLQHQGMEQLHNIVCHVR